MTTTSPSLSTLIKKRRHVRWRAREADPECRRPDRGQVIKKISGSIITAPGATAIDADGRVMMPRFIATHEHPVGEMPFGDMFTTDTRYAGYVATKTSRTYLMNDFTAVRDAAGNTFSLKLAIDRGDVVGSRVHPSGPVISRTSGHADRRHDLEESALLGGSRDPMTRNGDMVVVGGVPGVLKGARENPRRGASPIKIAVGGSTGSYADPLDVIEFTPEEIRAAVQAVDGRGVDGCRRTTITASGGRLLRPRP